ncbi:MAG TPA: glycosyltransferase [Candidatus Binatus sp.]|jgi:glycosyltransferase involved in cell wall biosynthesis|nr:glycosyltransferase [Candidatus Binatus sp.]
MRILFLHGPADLYGASRSLLRLTSRLVREGNCVSVILPADGDLARQLRAEGVLVIVDEELAIVSRQEFRNIWHVLRFARLVFRSCRRLSALVREHSPDVIHTNTALILPGGIVGRLCRIPHICHVREIFVEFSKVWVLYQWFLYMFCDRILCVSHAVAEQFHPRIRARKIQVLHNGFPLDEFNPVPEERVIRFRDSFGLNGQRLIGLVGRIRFGRKGQDVFLRAAAVLKPKFTNLRFLCIGSPFPGNEDHLRLFDSLVEELGLEDSVLCTGDVEDIKAAYAALDISAHCSTLPEAFGGVVIESMAMGKPVVATAIGGTLEQIEDGRTGLLTTPGDEQELAVALEQLLLQDDLILELSQNGRKRFEQEFEFEKFFRTLMSVYEDVLKERRICAADLSGQAN